MREEGGRKREGGGREGREGKEMKGRERRKEDAERRKECRRKNTVGKDRGLTKKEGMPYIRSICVEHTSIPTQTKKKYPMMERKLPSTLITT